jgi:hypothetical protein
MNVNGMIAAMAATQDEKDRPRLKAAIGARRARGPRSGLERKRLQQRRQEGAGDGKAEALRPVPTTTAPAPSGDINF